MKIIMKVSVCLAIVFALLALSTWIWSHLESNDLRFIMSILSGIIIGFSIGCSGMPWIMGK